MVKRKVFQISNALTDGLEQTVSAAQDYKGVLRVEIIPLSKIEIDSDNPRELSLTMNDLTHGLIESDPSYSEKIKDKERLQSLAHSIKEQGIINPVLVYKSGEKYQLIAGERRTLASVIAGQNTIQAKIVERKLSRLELSLLQWIENMERSDLSLWERINNLEKILLAYISNSPTKDRNLNSITATELKCLIGCTLPHAMNYKSVLLSNDKIKNLIRENKLKNLEKAALLANIKSDELQQEAIEACLAGATLKKIKIWVENAKKNLTHFRRLSNARGRQATKVNLGSTSNLSAAKTLIDSVLQNPKFQHLEKHFLSIDWHSYPDVTRAFHKLLESLEVYQ